MQKREMVLLTGDTAMVCVYVLIPMCYLIVCADTKLLKLVSVWSVGANVIGVGYKILHLHLTSPDDIADYEIQVLAVLLFMIYAYLSTKLQRGINEERLNTVLTQEEETEKTLSQILSVADSVSKETASVLSMVEQVEESSNITVQSMDEITTGTTQTSDSIQAQLAQTEQIQGIIKDVNEISESMQATIQDSYQNIETGVQNMDSLTESASLVQQINSQLNAEMNTLVDQANQALDIR